MSVLRIEHLRHDVRRHFWTPPRTILKDVCVTVERGEILGFMGPNGAGKTTTIKAVLGLLRPQSGTIEILGGSPSATAVRRRLGYLPEQPYFPAHMSAHELVVEHGLLSGLTYGDSRRRAREVLGLVGLSRTATERLKNYSKGMLQRAGIAQALVGDPDLVIFDEPMSGLDPLGRRDVRELMVELRRRGKTVFFSTHILPDVEIICDRVAIIVAGETRAQRHLAELTGAHVDRVEVTSDVLPDALVRAATALARRAEPRSDAMVFECAEVNTANSLLDLLRQHQITVRSVQAIRPSLEDLFVQEAAGNAERPS